MLTNLLSKVLSLQWDESYVELLKTASNLKHQLAYARAEEPSKVDVLERKISRYMYGVCFSKWLLLHIFLKLSNQSTLALPICFFRNEKTIAGIEKKNSVRVRWKESDATFHSARERLTAKRRSNEILALHKLASERVFLLELKAKYTGMHMVIFIEILKNSRATKEWIIRKNFIILHFWWLLLSILQLRMYIARLSLSFVMQAV